MLINKLLSDIVGSRPNKTIHSYTGQGVNTREIRVVCYVTLEEERKLLLAYTNGNARYLIRTEENAQAIMSEAFFRLSNTRKYLATMEFLIDEHKCEVLEAIRNWK